MYDYKYEYELSWRRWTISFIPIISICWIMYFPIAFLTVFAFYAFTAVVYVVSLGINTSMMEKRSVKRKLRIYQDIITRTQPKLPEDYQRLNIWLVKEGFLLKTRSTSVPYLESKTVLIDFYPDINKKISIKGTKNDKDYLVYNEDEELRLRIESFLGYLTKEYNRSQTSIYKFNNLNKNIGLSDNFLFGQKFAYFIGRGQGYLFLLIFLYNWKPTDDSTNTTFLNLLVASCYLLIENLI